MVVSRIMSSTRLHSFRQKIPNLNFMICLKCHNDKGTEENRELPEEPTSCCMSGCANCVWLDYAEKLSQLYKDGGEEAVKRINEKVTDPNMKAFLMHELRMKILK